ncbi:hypothetical protein COLO4_19072 [Corchorus olitorius]|uniref:Uncharacterized protein n=1 Tax=Corchorus olitorius TaxID=93759 RepID=A0A1R3J6S2_9ROSI|nr:hypothetical protein COLO4_19072 [Corchorus olitorius]
MAEVQWEAGEPLSRAWMAILKSIEFLIRVMENEIESRTIIFNGQA